MHDSGAPLECCIGIETVTPITGPGLFQKDVYNSHKCQYTLKFQLLMFPMVLLPTFSWPIEEQSMINVLIHERACTLSTLATQVFF